MKSLQFVECCTGCQDPEAGMAYSKSKKDWAPDDTGHRGARMGCGVSKVGAMHAAAAAGASALVVSERGDARPAANLPDSADSTT